MVLSSYLTATEFAGSPNVWSVRCSACGRGCVGMGWCPGDAIGRLPCKSPERMGKAGLEWPDWKEELRHDEGRYMLV